MKDGQIVNLVLVSASVIVKNVLKKLQRRALMKVKKINIAIAAAITTSFGLISYQSALAQQAPAPAPAAGLEEITVSATRRLQNLQEVPISIVAITGENLVVRGIDNLEKVSQGVPNVIITGGGGGTGGANFRMRGIPNVGTYVDGVWQVGTAGFLTQEFVDIDRVEVLRGPQGTMFGRDSTGGAIRIWTKRPTQDFNGSFTTTMGSLDRLDMKGSVNLPISENIKTKWTVANMARNGYIDSLTTGEAGGGIDQQVMRGDIVWDVSDTLSVRAGWISNDSTFTEPRIQDAIFRTYDDPNPACTKQLVGLPEFYTYVKTDALGKPVEPFFSPANQVAGFPGGQVGLWQNKSGSVLPNRYETDQASVEVNWQLPYDIDLMYLGANVKQDTTSVVDWDNSQYVLVEDINRGLLNMTSHELQLTTTIDRFDLMGGYYKWDQNSNTRNGRWVANEFKKGILPIANVLNSAACNPVGGVPKGYVGCAQVWANATSDAYDQLSMAEQGGYAFFGETTMHVNDKIDLTLGLRKHSQEGYSQGLAKTADTALKPLDPTQLHIGDPFAGTKTGVPNKFQFEKNTMRAVAQYTFSDDLNVYASYSEGFNSGGVSVVNINLVRTEFPYKPSTLKNREIGFRSDLLDSTLRLNVTVFSTIWADLQASGVVSDPVTKIQIPQLVTTNVGEAEAKGIEVELTYVPTDNLQLSLGLGKLSTAYTKIAPGTMSGHLPFNSGTEFAAAPDRSWTLGAQYSSALGSNGTLLSRLDYNYQGQFWRSEPFLRVSGYAAVPKTGFEESGDWGVMNMRFTYEPTGADWDLSLFGTNLTDQHMLNSGFFHGIWGFDFATVGRPRELGLTFNYRL